MLAFQPVLGRVNQLVSERALGCSLSDCWSTWTAALCRVGLSALAPPGKPQQLLRSPTHRQGLGVLYSQLGIGVYRYRLSVGTNEKIQLSSLIAAFQVTRDLIVSEA